MPRKMLIDAAHAEETRVVVVDGNRVEEFDFESETRRQLAGNIYLAKVTRVEPSLQAAFVDYGGNRHGFLAFSEIHPDYYQIPIADREALMEEERAYAEALREQEENAQAEKKRSRVKTRSKDTKSADFIEKQDINEGDAGQLLENDVPGFEDDQNGSAGKREKDDLENTREINPDLEADPDNKPAAEEIPPRSEILKEVLVSFVPLFSLIILVLGTILAGLATPAEAAAVGAFGALVLSYFYKSLKWKNFKESVFLTAKTSAMIMWLFVGSWTFASVFSYLGGHEVFEHFFKSMDIQPWQFLVITQIIIFLLGWPLEWTEILIIFVPIFLPLVEFFGVNPYFFAMLIALNLQTSFLTPPMAMSAYYLKGVQSRNVQLMEIFRGIMPFLGIVILAMVLMYIFPGIALWLPDTLFAD